MRKTVKIDLSSDRLVSVAADLVENHNYIGALKLLNKNTEKNVDDEESLMLYAEIFDDIGLHERCVNCWFKYIDMNPDEELTEAYEGLAVAYMNLGNEHFSAYYYNKLLSDTDGLDPEMRGEIMSSFLSRDENPLKFVYPPKIADYSDIISAGIDAMRRGEYDNAIAEFEKVEEENSAYLSARNYIAMCNIICDKCDEAEQECLNILKKHPDSVQALTTLAAVKTEQKKSEESRDLARRLLTLKVTSSDDVYKIATVCCENKLHEEAYDLFCKLEDELAYDSSVLYFKAVSSYNCGKFEESFKAFDKLLTIDPNAVTARYYYDRAREAAEKGEELELSYFYRLPKEERESTFKVLAAISELSMSEIRKLYGYVDITDCIHWCFDESDSSNENELQQLAAVCAVKAGMDGLICDILLNAFISDSLKIKILTLIGERNEENFFGVVICNIYKRIFFRSLAVGRPKRKFFVSAYASLTAHFGVIEAGYGEKFAVAAEKIYFSLSQKQLLGIATDVNALTAAVYFLSGVKEPKVKRERLASFFDADEEKIQKILGEL